MFMFQILMSVEEIILVTKYALIRVEVSSVNVRQDTSLALIIKPVLVSHFLYLNSLKELQLNKNILYKQHLPSLDMGQRHRKS